MSVITPAGGNVTPTQTTFWGPDGYPCSVNVRIINLTNLAQSYTLGVVGPGIAFDRCYQYPIPANSYVDIELGLKRTAVCQLQHLAANAGALAWSVTGYQDDGS